jgi:S-adenosylmethionine decarboxylase proenzyme
MFQKTKRSIQWVIENRKRKYSGIHLIAEFWYGKNIEDPKKIKEILIGAVKEANNTPLKVAIHKFQPQGITGIVLLAESHIALHTWPEFNYTAIDIYTCGDKANPEKALKYLKQELQPKKVEIKKLKRGRIIR